MSLTVINEAIANVTDLTVATTAIIHGIPIGHRINVWDDTKEMEKSYIYLQISTGQGTKNVPYVVNHTYTTGLEVNTLTPVCTTGLTPAATQSEVIILPVTCTSGTYAWAQTKGAATAAITASTAPLTVGKLVSVINGAAVVSSSTAGAVAIQPSNAFGIVTASATSASTTVAINMYGRLVWVTT
jgi:hypothetical protein